MSKKAVLFIVFALLLLSFACYTLVNRIEPYMYQFYVLAWWSYICFLDAALSLRSGRFHVLNRRFAFLLTLSAGFWCIFEVVNVLLQNWFYINCPQAVTDRFTGYFVAYGTVIPAILLTRRLVDRILPGMNVRPLPLGGYPRVAIPLGVACLAFALAFPLYCFSLVWVFSFFVVDGWNYHSGYPSFAADLERGDLEPMVASAIAGLICGVLWEFWNYWSITKWVYTVPFFENLKIFEMPALGFLGFAFFALEVMAFVSLVESSPLLSRSKWALSAASIAFCLVSFVLIDRYTVFSHTARVSQLPFLSEGSRRAIETEGVATSYAIDPGVLSADERERLALLHLKGLGLHRYEALDNVGIHTVAGLSTLNQEVLSSIMGEKSMRRVRVYLRAAKTVDSRQSKVKSEK